MSSELFIHRSLLPFLAWLALCTLLAGIILTALDKLKKPRKPEPVVVKSAQKDDLVTTLDALDRVIRTLERYDLEEWKAQYSLVEEAELVAEQYQARLESEREG